MTADLRCRLNVVGLEGAGSFYAVFLLLMVLSVANTGAQPASSARGDFWLPNGPIHALAQTNGILYLGGSFDYIGPNAGTGGTLDLFSGNRIPDFPKANGSINVAAVDGAGGWFVGGQFTTIGGQARSRLESGDRRLKTSQRPFRAL